VVNNRFDFPQVPPADGWPDIHTGHAAKASPAWRRCPALSATAERITVL
jgi:hypothetical protein